MFTIKTQHKFQHLLAKMMPSIQHLGYLQMNIYFLLFTNDVLKVKANSK